jgi:hypothetical protein
MPRVHRLLVLIGSLILCGAGPLTGQPASAQTAPAAAATSSAHVYFLTGLFGVGSGLDGIAVKTRNLGLPISMSSPNGWQAFGQSAVSRYRGEKLRSVIIVGYSAGGGAALEMAGYLNAANVPTQLVVIFDGLSLPPVVPPNIRKLVNYYVPGGIGTAIARPAHFRGTLQNVPVNGQVGHFSIINAYERHVLEQMLSAAGRPARRTSAPPGDS